MSEDAHERTERGARLIGAGIIISRLLGVVRQWLFTHFLGSGMQTDAYNNAVKVPNALRNLLGEGAISASFVPVYAAALERGDEQGARALANALLGVLLVGVSLLTIAGIALAPQLTAVLAAGFDAERAALCSKLMQVMFPMTGLMVLSGWCLGVQNAHHRFFMAYASGAMWSIAQIALLLVAGPSTSDLTTLVWWVSWATVVGAVLQISAQIPQVMRLMKSVRPTLQLSTPGLRQTLRNFVPVVAALGLFQISSFIDMQIASFLTVGAPTNLQYATNIYLLPLSLFGIATAAAALPQMARETARGQTSSLTEGLSRAWERVLFYTIPSAVAFIGIGDAIVDVLTGRGKFSLQDRHVVHVTLAALGVGLVAYASSRLLTSSYQATGNYRRPFVSAAWAIAVSTVVSIALAIPFREHPLAVAGLAGGAALGAFVNFTMLWKGVHAQIGVVDVSGPLSIARRTLLVSLIAVAPGIAVHLALPDLRWQGNSILTILTYCAAFLVAAKLARLAEAERMLAAVARRFSRRG
ncbi:MAG TPA: murein biosynthesis integral membrane protein MurJ [Gemmatimonadaceae bacterium]|nr:murein biosynthesis integral membrane protein MurJ [Gemmatimonadaceae bacterium]